MTSLRARVTALASLALSSAGCAAVPAHARTDSAAGREPWGRQSNLLVGVRSFDDDWFGRTEDQLDLALDYCEPIGLESVRVEGGLHYSFDTASDALSTGRGVELKGESLEFSAGLNAGASLTEGLRPYLGLGASLLCVQLRQIDVVQDELSTDQDATFGGYLKCGLLLQVARSAHVGLEYRHLESGDLSLDGDEIDGGYDQLAFLFGATL